MRTSSDSKTTYEGKYFLDKIINFIEYEAKCMVKFLLELTLAKLQDVN